MNKSIKISNIIACFILALPLISCSGGGGSSSSPAPAPAPTPAPAPAPAPIVVGNYNQLTPVGGVNVTSATSSQTLRVQENIDQVYYTTFGNNGSTLYAGTSTGQVLQMNSSYTGWTQVATATNNLPIIAIAGNSSNGVYYAPYPSNVAYSTTGSGFTNGLDSGSITAITSSNNGSIYFGTSDGNVGLTNNPASKVIATTLDPTYGPIVSIGCTGNSCNSGQQGVLVFQAESSVIPAFESSTFASTPAQYIYPTKMYYLDQSSWIDAIYDGTISTSKTVTVESTTYAGVPEFITTVTINASTSRAYAGTNFFNIYSAPLNCNSGQGCTITWSSTPINTVPLSTVTNGTQGITSIAVLSNGSLYVVGNYSESIINLYQSESTNN